MKRNTLDSLHLDYHPGSLSRLQSFHHDYHFLYLDFGPSIKQLRRATVRSISILYKHFLDIPKIFYFKKITLKDRKSLMKYNKSYQVILRFRTIVTEEIKI